MTVIDVFYYQKFIIFGPWSYRIDNPRFLRLLPPPPFRAFFKHQITKKWDNSQDSHIWVKTSIWGLKCLHVTLACQIKGYGTQVTIKTCGPRIFIYKNILIQSTLHEIFVNRKYLFIRLLNKIQIITHRRIKRLI